MSQRFQTTTEEPFSYDMTTEKTNLSSKIVDVIRLLIEQGRSLSRQPSTQFTAGFISAILIMALIYSIVKVSLKLLHYSSMKVAPSLIGLCLQAGYKAYMYGLVVGPYVYGVVQTIGRVIFVVFGAFMELVIKERRDPYAGHKKVLLSNGEKIETLKFPPYPNNTSNQSVFVYDREMESASIVE